MRIRWGKAAAALLFALALCGRGAAAQAHAGSREQREAEAYQACAAGRVEAGIEILASLLVDYGHPNYIYNQARCYQQNGRAAPALSRFREYRRAVPNGPPEERARIDRFVAELEAELRRAPAPPASAPAALVTAGPSAAPSRVAPAMPALRDSARDAPVVPAPHRLRPWAVALAVLAVAGSATGIAAGLHVRSLSQEVETAPSGRFSVEELAAQQSQGQRFEAIEWIGYGLGSAAALGAAVIFVLDARAAGPRGSDRLTAQPLPAGGATLLLRGRF